MAKSRHAVEHMRRAAEGKELCSRFEWEAAREVLDGRREPFYEYLRSMPAAKRAFPPLPDSISMPTPMTFLHATWQLYREALRNSVTSFVRGWRVVVAVIAFFVLMLFATTIVGPLGLAGGLILGAVNALLIGSTLALFETAILSTRGVTFQDIFDSFGKYFWDVMGVLFVLWLPLMLLDEGMRANPNGAFLSSAVFLLLFILLNPAPEVIYQVRHGSPLEVFKTSYEFVLENWVEWFLPLFVVIGPLGMTFFLNLSTRLGRGAGLNFLQLLVLPVSTLSAWLGQLGISDEISSTLVLLLTPPLTVFMFLFRGHLFHTLHRSSRRTRLFKTSQQL